MNELFDGRGGGVYQAAFIQVGDGVGQFFDKADIVFNNPEAPWGDVRRVT